jgi:hypothetical protein
MVVYLGSAVFRSVKVSSVASTEVRKRSSGSMTIRIAQSREVVNFTIQPNLSVDVILREASMGWRWGSHDGFHSARAREKTARVDASTALQQPSTLSFGTF